MEPSKEVMEPSAPKRAWCAPELIHYGRVEDLTAGCDKQFGGTDGFTFMGMDIVCRTS